MMLEKFVNDARVAWRALNGIFVVYKPAGVSHLKVRHTIIDHLCKDLNAMNVREPWDIVSIEGETNKPMTVKVQQSYGDHVLVVGPRYQNQDIRLLVSNKLGKNVSGVQIFGVNDGTKLAYRLAESKATSFYRVKGILGQATDNYFIDGNIKERSTYKFITRGVIEKLCASMQSSHQRKMFELSGVDMQSQAAYELAVQGPIRPSNIHIPMIYAIKCVDFQSPEFILEIVCINENEMYLKTLIHDMGIRLHSVATCSQIQCFQHGLFGLKHALLKKHWDLEAILGNIYECSGIIEKSTALIRQTNPILQESVA